MTASSNPIVLRQTTAQPTGKATPLTFDEGNANTLNMMRYTGQWADPSPDSYIMNQSVYWMGGFWLAIATTQAEPGTNTDWAPVSPIPGISEADLATPPAAGTDIAVGDVWDNIDYYDTISITGRGITIDTVTGYFQFSYRGIWQVMPSLNISFTDVPRDRSFFLRLWDVTNGAERGRFRKSVPRNSTSVDLVSPFLATIITSLIGDSFVLQVGDANEAITGVQYEDLTLSAYMVSVLIDPA